MGIRKQAVFRFPSAAAISNPAAYGSCCITGAGHLCELFATESKHSSPASWFLRNFPVAQDS